MAKSSGIVTLLFVLIVAADAQKVSVLYRFGTNTGDPLAPQLSGIIAQGRDGNLYTTAPYGGANNLGTVFKITPAGKLTVLYSFVLTDDGSSSGGLTLGTDGNFYGTDGFALGGGTVFKITPRGNLTALHNFRGSEGIGPVAPPVQGRDGNLYGTAPFGGIFIGNCDTGAEPFGCGTVYKITPSGKFTTLYMFDCGRYPYAPLVQATDGNLYGTTGYGGGSNCNGEGEVFKITTAGKLTALYNFDFGGAHGSGPVAPLIQGSDGNFYGTACCGESTTCYFGCGLIFKITPDGKLTTLHRFNGTDGANPFGGLVQATDGNFYGTTSGGGNSTNCSGGCGTIFRITPKGSYSVLYNFDNSTGASPATLFQHTNGILYGDTAGGGIDPNHQCGRFGCGVFYSLNVGLKPFVSLLPYSGRVGDTIEFLGQGFKGTAAVCFNGKAAKFKVVSDTYLTATVPKGATTGFVTVTTSKGKLKSNKKFRVTS